MDKLKMAACGIDCEKCGQYRVTTERSMEAAELLADWFRAQGWIGENEGAGAVMKKVPLCKGCWNITEDCFWKCGCGSTDFRVCCTEKQINHCGECDRFPCEAYKEWADWHESHKRAWNV